LLGQHIIVNLAFTQKLRPYGVPLALN
jgi:hypothetical protein